MPDGLHSCSQIVWNYELYNPSGLYESVYGRKRMEQNYLKINELKEGYLYRIRARNAKFGIWIKEVKGFIISRHKFGYNYLFIEYHYDTGPPFGTVFPIEEIEKVPIYIPRDWFKEDNNDLLKYLNKKGNEL